jgi:hypothetical protein
MEKASALLGDELAQNAQMYLARHGRILTFAVEKGKTMNGRPRPFTVTSPCINEKSSCRFP